MKIGEYIKEEIMPQIWDKLQLENHIMRPTLYSCMRDDLHAELVERLHAQHGKKFATDSEKWFAQAFVASVKNS